MNVNYLAARLAVCSWSLRPTGPDNLLQQLQTIGIPRVQIALDPLREQPMVWGRLPELCAKEGIQLVSGMFGTVGEDYSTLESIKRTGGVVPDATWEENWRNIQEDAALAQKLNLKLVTLHAGFLPHEPSDPAFQKVLQRITRIADLFAGKGIDLGFETGQETAATLRSFLERLNRPSVGVNFDPANMILYDKGDPIAALRILGPWLKQCHLKDAVKTEVPGTWGDEVVVGTGQVDWRAFFRTLDEVRFQGELAFEREAGEQRAADIQIARQFIGKILA
jgi:L-ribulose-5-phosphate 3-epimerase